MYGVKQFLVVFAGDVDNLNDSLTQGFNSPSDM